MLGLVFLFCIPFERLPPFPPPPLPSSFPGSPWWEYGIFQKSVWPESEAVLSGPQQLGLGLELELAFSGAGPEQGGAGHLVSTAWNLPCGVIHTCLICTNVLCFSIMRETLLFRRHVYTMYFHAFLFSVSPPLTGLWHGFLFISPTGSPS